MSSIVHWGELSPVVDTDSAIAAMEREEITKLRPIELNKSNFDMTLDDNTVKTKLIRIGNPTIIHSIKLMEFIKKLESNQSNDLSSTIIPLLSVEDRSAVEIKTVENIFISEFYAKKLLKQSIILLTKYIGYDMTTESILNLLVDVTCHYLTRMCHMLRMITDHSELRSDRDFVDVIDRVFHEMSVPDIQTLRKYHNDINSYNHNLQKKALLLHQKSTKNQSNIMSSYNNSVDIIDIKPSFTIKEEELNEEPNSNSILSPFDAPKTNFSGFLNDETL